MKRILMYKGKTINEMSKVELDEQYKMNKIRLIYRSIFLILVAISAVMIEPLIAIMPVALLIITGYWLIQNNNEIKKEAESR